MPSKAKPPDTPLAGRSPGQRAHRVIKEWIDGGSLPAGETLPSQYELAERLDVGRTAVRFALKRLQTEGLLQSAESGKLQVAAHAGPHGSLMSQTIAILTSHPSPADGFGPRVTGWDLFVRVGAIETIRSEGLHALALQPAALEGPGIQRLLSMRPRGVIALNDVVESEPSHRILHRLKDAGVPVVVYGGPDELPEFDGVTSDQRSGAYDLTRWLIGEGRRRILRVWLAPPGTPGRSEWLRRRDEGHLKALKEAKLDGLEPLDAEALYVFVNTREEFDKSVRLCAGYLIERLSGRKGADAAMVTTDGAAFLVAAAVRLLGKVPNEDVLITGYDSYWEECLERQWEPAVPAATVDRQNPTVGRELVVLLQDRLKGALGPDPERRVIKPVLRITDLDRPGAR